MLRKRIHAPCFSKMFGFSGPVFVETRRKIPYNRTKNRHRRSSAAAAREGSLLHARRPQGADSLEDHELLELLLFFSIPRRDTNALAHTLLARFGSLRAVMTAPEEELCDVAGMGESSALLLHLVGELQRRCDLVKNSRIPLDTLGRLSRYCASLLRGRRQEEFYALLLDARFHLIRAERIASGLPDQLTVYPRAVAEAALKSHAVHVALAHNHPAGNSAPSRADIAATEQIRAALAPLGITLSEHIIVTEEDTYAICAGGPVAAPLRAAAPAPAKAAQSTGVLNARQLYESLSSLDEKEFDRFLNLLDDDCQ